MKTNILLSVIITVYNEAKYVEECITSVINQTYKHLDIVIVDDGSNDGSSIICDSFLSKDNRIRVIHKPNGGSVSARKVGVIEARGKYITYIDGDDWLLPNHYEQIMSNINDSDIFAFGLSCVYSDDRIEKLTNEASNGVYADADLQALKSISLYSGKQGKFGLLPSMCSKIFRTELIKNNMLNVNNDIRMGDDGACTFPSICDATKIIVDNEIFGYMYRKTKPNSITSSYSYLEFVRINNLFHVLNDAFNSRNASYMYPQLSYYLAFLFRIEMINELAYLKPSNFYVKIKHIREIRRLDWIKYLISTFSSLKLDSETTLLLGNIKCIPLLFFKWYFLIRLRSNSI